MTVALPSWVDALRPHQEVAIKEILGHYARGVELVLLDGPTGCLAADTKIKVQRNSATRTYTIKQVAERHGTSWSTVWPTRLQQNHDGYVRLGEMAKAWPSGVKLTYTLTTVGGRVIRASAEHPFHTPTGWTRLIDLNRDDEVLVNIGRTRGPLATKKSYRIVNSLPHHPYAGRRGVDPTKGGFSVAYHRLVAEAVMNDLDLEDYLILLRLGDIDGLAFLDPAVHHVHHIDEDHTNNAAGNLEVLSQSEHHRIHAENGATNHVLERVGVDTVETIVAYREEPTYDIKMADGNLSHYIANEFVVHNSGKTLVSEMVRQELGVSGLYVPHTKTLQSQFVHNFDVPVLMGRANYPVSFAGLDLTAADCQGKGCKFCPEGCPYQAARVEAYEAQLATLNTAYFLHQANIDAPISFSGRGLVTVDEADQLRVELMGYVSVFVGVRTLKELGLEELQRGSITKPEKWLEWLQRAIPRVKARVKELPARSPATGRDVGSLRHRNALIRLQRNLNTLVTQMEANPEAWVYTGKGGVVEFKPTTTEGLAEKFLWRHAQKWLLMSATWVSAELEVQQLGWDREWALVEMPSTFDPARRPVHIVPIADMSKKAREADEHWAARMVDALVRIWARESGEPMLVHTVTYDITAALVRGLRAAGVERLWTYASADERAYALEQFKEHGGMLIAPSMDRGVDFADDLCRVVVIAKVPYPDLNDRQVSAQMHDGRSGQMWYSMLTVRTVVQMSGRAMRHEGDRCSVWVLDGSFVTNLWRRNHGLFPKWWEAALDWRTTL